MSKCEPALKLKPSFTDRQGKGENEATLKHCFQEALIIYLAGVSLGLILHFLSFYTTWYLLEFDFNAHRK